jgi:hypothetical protein
MRRHAERDKIPMIPGTTMRSTKKASDFSIRKTRPTNSGSLRHFVANRSLSYNSGYNKAIWLAIGN